MLPLWASSLGVRACRSALLVALTLALSVSKGLSEAPPDDVLHRKTKQAEERVKKWDAEDRKIEKRNRWEVPLATAMLLVGGAAASRNQPYLYATSFALALGLGFHFWTHRKPPAPGEAEEL